MQHAIHEVAHLGDVGIGEGGEEMVREDLMPPLALRKVAGVRFRLPTMIEPLEPTISVRTS